MGYIKDLDMYMETMDTKEKKDKFLGVINWIKKEFPKLKLEIKWNQPMFINDNTFIISLSALKNHFSIAPEFKTMELFKDKIDKAGYSQTKMLFRIKFNEEINFNLLKEIIDFNIEDKKGMTSFWRENDSKNN